MTMENAINFVKDHAESVGEYAAIHFQNGKMALVEKKFNYLPVLEWLEKYPKYVRACNLHTGKILIANTLYIFQYEK